MATAVLSNTPTVIDNAESVTNWGGDSFSLETDIKVQGSNSVACAFTPNNSQEVYVSGSWDLSGGEHLRLWMNSTITAYLNTKANNGIQIFISDGSNSDYWTVGGSDTYAGGWEQFIVYTGNTPTEDNGANHASITRIGLRMSVTRRPKNVTNLWLDAWTYGDGYTVTGGTSGDEIDWSHIAALDKTNAYGVVTEVDGIYFLSGDIKIGNGSTTTYFKHNKQKCQFLDRSVSSTLYSMLFQGTGCHVTLEGGLIGADGTQNFVFDANDTNLASFSMSGLQISQAGLSYFKSGQTIQNNVFDSCGQIDPSTSTFQNNTISNFVGTTGAVLYPSDDSNIKDLTFLNCDIGVEYGSGSDSTSPAFDNFQFDDVSGNYDVNNTSGGSVSISKNNGSNPNSYTGSAVTFLGASVTTKVTVKDIDTGTAIQNARVLVYVADGTNFNFEETVTMTGSGTTVTVSHTAHGRSTGDHMIFSGANEDMYNGAYSITVTGVDSYTFTANESVSSSPATGTIKATFAFIDGLTDVNGEISDIRVVANDQLIAGRVRKSSASPYYVQGKISGTVSSTSGFSTIIQLVRDE